MHSSLLPSPTPRVGRRPLSRPGIGLDFSAFPLDGIYDVEDVDTHTHARTHTQRYIYILICTYTCVYIYSYKYINRYTNIHVNM